MLLPSSLLALLFTILPPAHVAAETGPSINASLVWGPYRPNLYMGIRPRMPDSLIAGLMWGQLDDFENSTRTSHWEGTADKDSRIAPQCQCQRGHGEVWLDCI